MKNLSGIGKKMNCRNLIMTKHLAIRLCKKKQREENSQRNKYGNEEFKKNTTEKGETDPLEKIIIKYGKLMFI